MKPRSFEVCLCRTCGLRFPREQSHTFGIRCPHCLGETEIISQKSIFKEQMKREKNKSENPTIYAVVLDNIRSAWNVGSIFRSADGFGFEHVYLCGITPSPDNESVKKTSLGAEETLTWSSHKNAVELIKNLKAEGWNIWALEESEKAKQLTMNSNQFLKNRDSKTLLIVGSEVSGVDEGLLSLCDEIFFIPMQGEKRSLNVAIAFSVAAFALRQNRY